MAVVEVKVNGLAVDAQAKSHVVILKEKDGERVLPIWIGPAEAQAIARELAGQRFPRPLTHDLLATIVEGLKARITRVVIADLKENTFFANLVLERDGEVISIDARPSDSIAVALRAGADLFVNEKLLAEPGEQEEPTEEEKADELRRFLENLDPEDFGKYNP
jgi:bifunctional DNase/RNase